MKPPITPTPGLNNQKTRAFHNKNRNNYDMPYHYKPSTIDSPSKKLIDSKMMNTNSIRKNPVDSKVAERGPALLPTKIIFKQTVHTDDMNDKSDDECMYQSYA